MNKYKYHHKVLTYLKFILEKSESLNNAEIDRLFAINIAEKFNIKEFNAEYILFSLKANECVTYNKNLGFQITDIGFSKQQTKFFYYKHKNHRFNYIKQKTEFIVAVLAIVTFFLSLQMQSNQASKAQKIKANTANNKAKA